MRRTEKKGPQCIGRSRGGNTTKLHLVAANDKTAIGWMLSAGQLHDAPQGRLLLSAMGKVENRPFLLMDRAYEDAATRELAISLGYCPVVPPKKNRPNPWEYDHELYKRRNEIERLFRRLKRFRRVCTRYDKLDVIFRSFVMLALIVDALC